MYENPNPGDETVVNLDDLWPPFGAVPTRRGDVSRTQPGGRESGLSRDEIVRTAVALADAEGAESVNMRRIAKQLGVGTMSLYWHVASKEHLLDLMLDAVEGEVEIAEPSGIWKDDLAQIARQERASLLRHRWMVDVMGGGPPPGPNMLLHLERLLASLDGLDIDTRTALQIVMTVITYVTGSALSELREIHVEREHAGSGPSEHEIEAGMAEWRERLERSGLFVHFLRILDERIDPDAAETRDERFEFGLRCVLDGIAASLPT
jgi:AcrR family transcriptional regulator